LLVSKKLGKRTVNYKFRDWLVSRQRYWGTPIPVIYCCKCGLVPVPEKDLPVILPDKVKFGEGNPLETSKEFVETKCPKCKGKAKRETDTMDTFFDSSWYYLRYCDSENNKEAFDGKKADYWMPVDQYIGGAEHACMHLIYARFFTKALRDLGFVKFDEPFPKLFNQGMLHASDGNKMSKSLGNVVNPIEMIERFSADSLRMNLMSLAAPDNDSIWNDKGMESSLRFISRIANFFNTIKKGKSGANIENKTNKGIKEITEDIENFKYNLAIIKIRALFEAFEQEREVSKNDLELFLKLLHPICPHITEELWHNLGNKTFISLENWPVPDKSKINPELDKQEQQNLQLMSDINNILGIITERGGKPKKIYLYALPKEVSSYNIKQLEDKMNIEVEIYSVADKNKYDPQNKAGKAKPGKPAIYVE
jgi:leucyl-tRNA synthetase